MKSALNTFERNISELRWFLRSLDLERSALSLLASAEAIEGDPSNSLSQWMTFLTAGNTKRRFDYNSIIISLYGLLEQYVEGLILGYTQHLNSVVPLFEELPVSIRNSHVELSTALISKLKQNRYKGGATEASVISNLHRCLPGNGNYQLNHEAFTQHTSNFRLQSINEIFSRIGITAVSQRIRFYSPFSEYLASKFLDRDPIAVLDSEAHFWLDDLAERRNEVAHGSVNQLLGFDLLLEYLDFIEAFGRALHEIIFSEGLSQNIKRDGIKLNPPIAVYNNSVVCMEMNNVEVKVGDILIAHTEEKLRPLLFGEISELQVEKQSIELVPAHPSISIGMKVPFRTKVNHEFTLLRSQV